MKRFEAHLKNGEVQIKLPDENRVILLATPEGHNFAAELITEMGHKHPSVLRAVEQKIKASNKSIYQAMKIDNALYIDKVGYILCSCCFGEQDEVMDYGGEKFHFECPRECRDFKFCPWNGYNRNNKDSFMVICGAKSEYHLTETERRIVLLIQKGTVDLSNIADIMCVEKATIWKHLTSVYRRMGVENIQQLIYKLKDENI